MLMRKVGLVLPLVLVASGVLLSFQNCSKVKFSQVATGVEGLSSVSDSVPSAAGADVVIQPPVCRFDGMTLMDGDSVNAFQTSSVPFGKLCNSEGRICSAGALSGSFSYSSCVVGQPASCLFNGVTYLHGQTVPAFQNSTVPFGNSCVSETRVCSNGELSGSYSYANCAVGQPATCLFDGKNIAHGDSVVSYQNSTVSFGSTCVQETRACTNGKLSGSYNYGTCGVAAPAVCLFNGATVAHGQSVLAYQTSNVAFGSACQAETRTCNNGSLSGVNAYASCTLAAAASCLFNGMTIAHGQVVIGFQSPIVASGGACASESRTCSNGRLTGSYAYGSCAALPGCMGTNKSQFGASGAWTVPTGAKYFCVRLIGGGGGGSGAGGDNGDNGYGGYAGGFSEQVYASALVPVGSVLSFYVGAGGGGGAGIYSGNNSMNPGAYGGAGGTTVLSGGGISQIAPGGAAQIANAPGSGGWTPGAQSSAYSTWVGGGTAGDAGVCNSNGNAGSAGAYGGGGGGGAGPHQCGGGRGQYGYGSGGAGGNGYVEISWTP